MGITRQRLNELEAAEKKLKAMQEMVSGKKSAAKPEDIDVYEDEPAEVHYSTGKTARMNHVPAKMMPPKEKRGLFGLGKKKKIAPEINEDLQQIKEKVTEESPEVLFQKWLEKKCRQNCHLCESCVADLERIFLE